jgi:hypothetical protein
MKPSFRDGIAQAVEQVLKELNSQGVQIEVDTADDNGELITYYDKGVIITLCHTFELSPGILDFTLFTADIKVYGAVSIKLNSKNVKIAADFRKRFTKLYTPLFKLIQEQKKNYGMNKAYQELTQGLNKMKQEFDAIDKFFQVASYLTRKGFELPEYKNYQAFINDLKVNQSELYSQMVFDILEADEKVNQLGLEVV